MIKIDLVGKKIKTFLVLGQSVYGTNPRYRCICDCGEQHEILGRSLRLETALCKCHADHSRKILYGIWANMMQRCENRKCEGYKDYGGRGIEVCERWRKFENFVSDMGERPEGKSLDRKENNGNYEPSNCRWATKVEQASNTRRNIHLTYNGITATPSEWSRTLGITREALRRRVLAGMPPDKVFKKGDTRYSVA